MSRVIHNRLLPFGNFLAINICGMIFVKHGAKLSRQVINHERIHTRQQMEMLILPFYIMYVLEWLVRFAMCRNWMKAYYALSFEREAYDNMNNLEYLKKRRLFAWVRYFS